MIKFWSKLAIGEIRVKLFFNYFRIKQVIFEKIKKVLKFLESLVEQKTFFVLNLSLNSKNNDNK